MASPPINYIDGVQTITQLTTPLPGVSCSNYGPEFSPAVLLGTSTGSVTPSRTVAGTPPTAVASVTIRIDAAGQVNPGTCSWSYSLNGAAFSSAGNVLSHSVGNGTTVTIANGSINPSFQLGDTFTFTTPGTWITQQGTDAESDANYRLRCKGRWPSLSLVPTNTLYQAWALSASTQVKSALVETDGTIVNQVNVTVAGQNGAVAAGVVNAVLAYINQRAPLTDLPTVASVVNTTLPIAATIFYRASSSQANLLTAVTAALQGYIASVGVGIASGTTKVLFDQVLAAMLTGAYSGQATTNPLLIAGITNITGLLLNGAGTDFTVTAGHYTVLGALTFVWTPV